MSKRTHGKEDTWFWQEKHNCIAAARSLFWDRQFTWISRHYEILSSFERCRYGPLCPLYVLGISSMPTQLSVIGQTIRGEFSHYSDNLYPLLPCTNQTITLLSYSSSSRGVTLWNRSSTFHFSVVQLRSMNHTFMRQLCCNVTLWRVKLLVQSSRYVSWFKEESLVSCCWSYSDISFFIWASLLCRYSQRILSCL